MKYKKLLVYLLPLVALFSFSAVQAQEQSPPPPPIDESRLKDENKIFDKIEVEAQVDKVAWRTHLEKNLVAYIADAATRGMKPGTYTVDVRFLVEKDGRITDVKALNDPGYNLATGAVRVVRTGPKWKAGELNGKKVRSYHTQPITFQIAE